MEGPLPGLVASLAMDLGNAKILNKVRIVWSCFAILCFCVMETLTSHEAPSSGPQIPPLSAGWVRAITVCELAVVDALYIFILLIKLFLIFPTAFKMKGAVWRSVYIVQFPFASGSNVVSTKCCSRPLWGCESTSALEHLPKHVQVPGFDSLHQKS